MKQLNLSIILFLLIFFRLNVYSKSAVIPYKIKNPSSDFNIEMGWEYAKLLSVTASIKKGINIYSPVVLKSNFKKLSINPQRTVTEEDLQSLGKSLKADFILTGSLSRIHDSYIAKSILYSVREKKVIAKSMIKSSDLFYVAEQDTDEIFFNIPDVRVDIEPTYIDISFLVDMSYNVSEEIDSIKKGIVSLANSFSGNWSFDTNVNIIPYSDKYTLNSCFISQNSLPKIKNSLKKMNPKGINRSETFKNAFSHSVNSIPWRKEADKILIIISNSNDVGDQFIERIAYSARRKKIAIYTVSLGLINLNNLTVFRQLSVIANGKHRSAAYYQRLYNTDSNVMNVFMESGRLFHSNIYDRVWERGLFYDSDIKTDPKYKIPIPILDEIFYDEKKDNLNPYNITNIYPKISGERIINSERLENNIDTLMNDIYKYYYNNDRIQKSNKIIAKAMISDNNISLWIRIKNKKTLEFLNEQKSNKNFPIGIIVQKSNTEPYGITFNPDYYVTDLSGEYIPQIIHTSLKSIIKKPDYYMSNGILNPGLWFISVKIERLVEYSNKTDIRDQ